MITHIVNEILFVIIATILGYAVGNQGRYDDTKRIFKLEIQNKALKREYNKVRDVLIHLKNKEDVFVDDKVMIIYVPAENDTFIDDLELWAND